MKCRKGLTTIYLILIIIIVIGGFLSYILPQSTLNNIEIIVEDIKELSADYDYDRYEYRLYFTIINNGFLPVTLKEPIIRGLWVTYNGNYYEMDSALLSAIVKLDANSYVEKEIRLTFWMNPYSLRNDEVYGQLQSQYPNFDDFLDLLMDEIVRHELNARASCLYSSKTITTKYDMTWGSFLDMHVYHGGWR